MNNKILRIGLLIHDADSDYAQEIISGIKAYCEKCNMMLIVFAVGEYKYSYGTYDYQARASASFISKNNLDGLIFDSATQSNHVTKEKLYEYISTFKDIPIINIGSEIPGIPSISVDCESGFRKLLLHLIDIHGCKRFALISVEGESDDAKKRTEVFLQVMKEKKIDFDESCILCGDFDYQKAYTSITNYVTKKGFLDFDVIVSLNDNMAYALLDFCKENHISIPYKFLVTGFDDIQRSAFSQPSLTSINQQLKYQGSLAAETMLIMLKSGKSEQVQYVSTKPRYRQSCGCIALDDNKTNYVDEDGKKLLFGANNEISTASEWFIKKNQLKHVMGYSNDMQVSISLKVLKKRLNKDIAQFNISGAAVCMYVKPVETESFDYFTLPMQAVVLSAFDTITGFSTDKIEKEISFNPNETLLPEGILADVSQVIHVVSLYNHNTQYGYLVYRPGDYDASMYEILCNILSSVLSASYYYTKIEQEKENLTESNRKLSRISRTDELTRLLNRRGLIELGQQSLNLAADMMQDGLVIFGDMDGLKKINDTYGHDAGDRAIIAEAMILKSTFRGTDIIARLSGDEFVIVAVKMSDQAYKKALTRLPVICEKWNKETKEPFTISISLGAVKFSEGFYDLTKLLKLADEAQYQVKRLKKITLKQVDK